MFNSEYLDIDVYSFFTCRSEKLGMITVWLGG